MKSLVRTFAAVAAAAVVLTACSGGDTDDPLASGDGNGSVVVGSANFPENVLLAEIYAQALESTGADITRRFNIGSREIYYDQIFVHGRAIPLRLRSLVGVIPLLAVEILEEDVIDRLPGFKKRMDWFLTHRTDLARHIAYMSSDSEPSAANADAHRADCCMKFRRDSFDVNISLSQSVGSQRRDGGPVICARHALPVCTRGISAHPPPADKRNQCATH